MYPKIEGSDTYGDYVVEQIRGKSNAEIYEMFVAGNNYWNEYEGWEEPTYYNIYELINYWSENYSTGPFSTVDEMCEKYGYNNIVEFAIDYDCINPQGYTVDYNNQIMKEFSINCPDGTSYESNTYIPYYEYPVTESGTYNFSLQAEGIEVSVSIDVEIESIFKTDGNGTILGLKDEILVSDRYNNSYGCMSITEINDIVIPDEINGEKITKIGNSAFSDIFGIKTITMSDNILEIGEYAFSTCYNLKTIQISKNVTILPRGMFYTCYSLEEISGVENITSIGNYAFYICNSLEEITIPNNVISIGESAFYKCTNLKKVIIPASVTSIYSNAFSSCTSLTNIYVKQAEGSISGSPWEAPNATVTWDYSEE